MKTYFIIDEADTGKCSACPYTIEVGDEVISDEDGVYHVECVIPEEVY